MDSLPDSQTLLLLLVVALVAFQIGRMTAGGASPEERAERRMRERQEAERLFSGLPPAVQQQADAHIQQGRPIEAIKVIREHSGAGLKESKQAVDYRRASMGAV